MKNNLYIDNLIKNYPDLKNIEQNIIEAINIIIDSYKASNKILCAGNGGSASDSEHLVGELMKSFVKKRRLNKDLVNKINDESLSSLLQVGLPAISLVSQTSLISATLNDQAADVIFAQQVLGYGKKGDVLVLFSTSGNSKNCVQALKVAKALDMKVISFTGNNQESYLYKNSDVVLCSPSNITSRIQEYHLPIYHAIALSVENEFFDE